MISRDMTILDIVEKYPSSQNVFHDYDKITGSCLMCQHLFCSLKETCLFYGLKVEDIVKDLEKAIDGAHMEMDEREKKKG